MTLKCTLISLIIFFIEQLNGDEILGCNGFVKSEIEINFSLVEIKLFTKQGSLKDHTECAPNNGYYFLPLYDKGEYILRVSPPSGWTFEPSEVALNVDGLSDSCSLGKDIDFFFKGFAVTGKVISLGETSGPKGVKVQLLTKAGDIQVSSTMTTDDGRFLFTPVLPGNYTVQVSHPSWNLSKSQVAVQVSNGNAEVPLNSLVVYGYDVSGTVTSDNEPITGVSFVLFRKNGKMPGQVIGCDSSPLPGFNPTGIDLDDALPICHVSSDTKGRFIFQSLPSGQYIVVPHYKGAQSIKFDIHPQSLPFTVAHNSLTLDTSFQVKGFSVSGRVLWSPEGKPYEGAVVLLNQKVVTKTGSGGVFHLDSMKAGIYKLLVQAPDLKFEEKTVKVNPNTPQLEDLVPRSYKVCGKITASKTSSSNVVENRPVVFRTSSGKIEEAKTDSKGSYCIFLSNGEYTASVTVSETEKGKGLQFAPLKKVVKVKNTVVSGIDFSQLRATIEGIVDCEKPCSDIAITLQAQDSKITVKTKAAGKTGPLQLKSIYTFNNVLPGDYIISVDPSIEWCWEDQEMPLTVSTEKVKGPTFKTMGVAITIISSHDTEVKYTLKDPVGLTTSGTEDIHKGSNRICVFNPIWREGGPSKDICTLEFVGCHGYENPIIQWSSGTVTVTAISHEYIGKVVTTENVNDLVIKVLTTDDKEDKLKPINSVRSLGPLTKQGKKNSAGEFEYIFSLQLAPKETVMLLPSASSLLFSPVSTEIVGKDDCTTVENGVVFKAERGRIVSGKVIANKAPLSAVQVTIQIADREDVISKTDSEGRYQFGPLGVHVQYRVTAEKEGYVLTGPNEEGIFYAHKLAEVIVQVKDKADGTPLQGVLLSMSGGENYRRNSQTGPEGTMAFLSLSPGEYYLRPMMKEYRFDPPSKIIAVKEGATVSVTLSGERVAYSVFGSVTSLSGDPEGAITVEAVGQGGNECTQFQEESTSEPNGQFRIRGLQPKCEYIVRVKEGPEINTNIVRSTPEAIPVKVINEDIQGIRLVVFHPISRTDITVYIAADTPEYLRSLRAKMIRDDTTLHTVRLSDYKATPTFALSTIALAFPSVPADGKTYYIHLESTLSQNTHTYSTNPVYFKANSSFRLVRFNFSPIPKAHDSELSQTSYLAIPLMIIAAAVYYHRVFVVAFVTQVLQAKYTPNNSYVSQRASLIDDSGSDTVIVEQITGKRKMKPRKT